MTRGVESLAYRPDLVIQPKAEVELKPSQDSGKMQNLDEESESDWVEYALKRIDYTRYAPTERPTSEI